jgi:hypothetical protein
VTIFDRPVPIGPPIGVHPALVLDLARLTTPPADLFATSYAAHDALTRHTAARPGFNAGQVINDLRQHAADLTDALDHPEGTRP